MRMDRQGQRPGRVRQVESGLKEKVSCKPDERANDCCCLKKLFFSCEILASWFAKEATAAEPAAAIRRPKLNLENQTLDAESPNRERDETMRQPRPIAFVGWINPRPSTQWKLNVMVRRATRSASRSILICTPLASATPSRRKPPLKLGFDVESELNATLAAC